MYTNKAVKILYAIYAKIENYVKVKVILLKRNMNL